MCPELIENQMNRIDTETVPLLAFPPDKFQYNGCSILHLSGHSDHEHGAGGVQGDVHQMIAPRLEPSHQMIQAKRGHAEGPVAPVRASIAQRCPPKVVLQQLRPRCARQEVWIRQDRSSATPIICSLYLRSFSDKQIVRYFERIYIYIYISIYMCVYRFYLRIWS